MPRVPPSRAHDALLSGMWRESVRVVEALPTTRHGIRLMAVQTLYCGRCGAPLLSGSVFCGRCGAPQVTASAGAPMVVTALAAPPAAPPAAYGYRVAQPGAFPGAGRVKVPQVMVIGGVLAILAVAVVA